MVKVVEWSDAEPARHKQGAAISGIVLLSQQEISAIPSNYLVSELGCLWRAPT